MQLERAAVGGNAGVQHLPAPIRELAAIRPDLPVLLLSGYVEDLTERELAGTAIRGVLRKPISGVDLSAALRAVLDET